VLEATGLPAIAESTVVYVDATTNKPASENVYVDDDEEPVEARIYFYFYFLSCHTTHTTTAERRARKIAGAEALAVARRPEEASRMKIRPPILNHIN